MATSSALKSTAFKGLREGESLECFIDRVVRPDTTFLDNCGEVVDRVVRRIHEHPTLSVSKVIKGGSLGKGTAVRNHSDVDLLVVLNDFNNLEDSVKKMKKVKKELKTHLKASRYDPPVRIDDIVDKSPFTLQFTVTCKDVKLKVDLLPIVDIFQTDTVESTLDIYNEEMKTRASLRKYYAKCVGKVQVDLVKKLPSKVKDLIRLFKYWNYTEYMEMSSYSMELIIIDAWRKQGCPTSFPMDDLVYNVAVKLADINYIAIAFDDFYDPVKYTAFLNLVPPYILDPVNPYHNLASSHSSRLDLTKFYEYSTTITKQQNRVTAEQFCNMFRNMQYMAELEVAARMARASSDERQIAEEIEYKSQFDSCRCIFIVSIIVGMFAVLLFYYC